MAAKRWKGGAAAISQVNTITVGGTAATGQIYTVTIGYRSVSYTATGTDTNNSIASGLQTALAASSYGEFQEVTWTVSSAVITGTAATAGIPFVSTSTATGTGTLVTATTTTSSGPNDVSLAINWDTGSLPIAGDDVYIDSTGIDLLWSLGALSAVTLNSLTISSTFQAGLNGTGTVGLPETNTNGTAYQEYRQRYWQIGASTLTVGAGSGAGSGRLRLDVGAVQTALVVHSTGSSLDDGLPALVLHGTSAANTADISGSSDVGFAVFGGESSSFTTVYVASGASGTPSLHTGAGCTITTLDMSDGTVYAAGTVGTLTMTGGSVTLLAGNVTAINNRGGAVAYLGTGTIGTLLTSGAVDFSQDLRGRTVTNCTLLAGGSISDPFRTVSWTNPITLSQCGLPDVSLDLGKNITLAPVDL